MSASYRIVGSLVNGGTSEFKGKMPVLIKLFVFVLVLLGLMLLGLYMVGIYDIP